METNKKSQPETITNKITADFIQAQLTGEIKELFNKSSFKFNQITIADHKLNADDLKKATTLKAKINYNYDTITNAETNLQITVNETITAKDISDAINKINYTLETNKKSQPETITNKITADFIQAQLTGEIKELFKKSSFKFNQITIADHKLNADDLKKATTLKAKINYNYDTITNAETNLQITVNDKLKLVDVITNTEVEGRNANNNIVIIPEVLSLNNNSGVVKEDLEIKEFNSASINNPGHAILTAKPESNFTGDVKITITKLINPKEEDLINAFKKTFNHLPEWSRKISDDDTAEQWLKQIKPIAESIAYGVLRDWGWKDWYDPNKLKLHEATVDGRNLTDDDLERKDKNDKYINIDIRFDYGDVKNDIITATLIKRFPPAEPY